MLLKTLALPFAASWSMHPHPHHRSLPLGRITLSQNLRRVSQHRWRAMVANPSMDYNASAKSIHGGLIIYDEKLVLKVLPAEACDIVGGEACEGEIGAEVKLKVDSPPMSSLSYNHDMDDRVVLNHGREAPSSSKLSYEWVGVHALLLDDKSITTWLSEPGIIAKQAEAELVSKEIGCHLI